MNCRQARREIYELLHGAPRDRGRLDQHLQQCDACRGELARLAKLDAALQEGLAWEPHEADLERVTGAILDAIGREPEGVVVRPLLSWPRLVASCAAVCVVFVGGLLVGRGVFPREIVRTKVVAESRIEERIVEVPVEVVKERVVTKEVPVVRTRVVYRDCPVPVAAEQAPAPPPLTGLQPVKLAEVAFPVRAVSWVRSVQLTHELVPAGAMSQHSGEGPEEGLATEPNADDSHVTDSRRTADNPAAARVAAVGEQSLSPSDVSMLFPD